MAPLMKCDLIALVVVPTDKRVGFGLCTGYIDRMRIRIGYLAELRKESREITERLFHSETKIKYVRQSFLREPVTRRLSHFFLGEGVVPPSNSCQGERRAETDHPVA